MVENKIEQWEYPHCWHFLLSLQCFEISIVADVVKMRLRVCEGYFPNFRIYFGTSLFNSFRGYEFTDLNKTRSDDFVSD